MTDVRFRLATERMVLVAASEHAVRSDLAGREKLSSVLGAVVPASWPPPLTDEGALRWTLQALEKDPQAAGWVMWYFLVKEADGRLTAAGCGGFTGRPAPDGTVEVGYSMLPEFQGKGLATAVVGALSDWALSSPGVRRVVAQTLPDLKASRRVLEKSGFRFAGEGFEQGAILYELRPDRRRLGLSTLAVSSIGLGCWQLSGGRGMIGRYWPALDTATERAIVETSLAGGVSWFDTAEIYGGGESERALSRALRDLDGVPDDLVIATKWFPVMRFAGNIRRTIGTRLEALGGRTIDLYQIHHWFCLSSIKAQMEAMADLVDAGVIRAIGVSNFSERAMRKAHAVLARRGIPLASNQIEYGLLKRRIESNGVLAAARELDITLIAYSPLSQGILTGKFHEDPALLARTAGPRRRMPAFRSGALARTAPLIDVLRSVAERHEATPAQVALAWTVGFHGRTIVAIPGATSAAQASANASSMRLSLSREELDRIDAASKAVLG